MNSEMKTGERVLIIAMIAIINLCFLIPVWQSGVNKQLASKISQTEVKIASNAEQKTLLQARIATSMTPEYLIQQSIINDVNFTRITPERAVRVAGI